MKRYLLAATAFATALFTMPLQADIPVCNGTTADCQTACAGHQCINATVSFTLTHNSGDQYITSTSCGDRRRFNNISGTCNLNGGSCSEIESDPNCTAWPDPGGEE